MPITIIVGGQYGSEAKGAIAGYLALKRNFDIVVRTGAVNAGHTVYYKGTPYKMQQLPVGWVNPNTTLVIGAGAMIHRDILESEVRLVSEATGSDIKRRLVIDPRAGVHTTEHTVRSSESNRHHLIGATGKGCSEAIIDRIRGRGRGYKPFGNTTAAADYNLVNTEELLNHSFDEGAKIMLEGTQGTLLDLYLGPYPYTTHKQVGPAQWMMEAGLSPSLNPEIIMVLRTYPIRVAGNSGPLPHEISWPILARAINKAGDEIVKESSIAEFEAAVRAAAKGYTIPVSSDGTDQHEWSPDDRVRYADALSEINATAWNMLSLEVRTDLLKLFEMTTVTKKLRRIARISLEDTADAARMCRPSSIALTFMNYSFPEYWYEAPEVMPEAHETLIDTIETIAGAPVDLVSYGPANNHIYDMG